MLVPITSVLVVVLLSMLVTRVATVALTLTGMSRESARFQARSALTGAGFTTAEAEAVVNHPVRRRIVMMLMLVGSAGIVTVIGGVALAFAQSEGTADAGQRLALLVVGLAVLLRVMNSRPVDRGMSRLIRRALRRYTDLEVRDYEALLDLQGGYTISELRVEADDWLAGRSLAELQLTDEGVLVLGVERAGGGYVGAPRAGTVVHPGDVLLLYGHGSGIADLDERPRGPAGDARHAEQSRTFAQDRS